MKRIKAMIALAFVASTVGALANQSYAYPPFLKAARKFGAKDCTFCHVNPEGGEPFNERGKWLIAEKDRRGADAVDPEWLVGYKPGSVKSEPEPTQKSTLEQEIIKLEVEWIEALKRGDKAGLARMLADDFLATDEDGRVASKAQYIDNSERLTLESYSYSDLSTRVYGDTAIVTGRWAVKGSYKGKDFSEDSRDTDVWIRKDGRWQVVATHSSRVAKPQ